jgi:hypothetical protein
MSDCEKLYMRTYVRWGAGSFVALYKGHGALLFIDYVKFCTTGFSPLRGASKKTTKGYGYK